MPDKELEIKLRATGGDAAAKEVEKVSEAVTDLNAETAKAPQGEAMFDWGPPVKEGREQLEEATVAVEDLGTTVTETAPAIEELTDAANDMSGSFNLGGTQSKSLMESLLAMLPLLKGVAGRIGLFVSAAKLGWDAAKRLTEYLNEIHEAGNVALPNLASTSQAAAIEAARLADAEERVAEAIKKNDANVAAYTSRLRALANEQAGLVDAELGATLAQIDLDELEGNLTEAEAITARYQAKLAAGDRKLALDREQLETELNQQRQQNELELQRYRELSGPAARAQAEQAQLERGGASSRPELAGVVAARNAANDAFNNAATNASNKDELRTAAETAQDAVVAAYAKLIEDKAAEVDALVAKVSEASSRVSAGRAAEQAIAGQIDNLATGPAAQAEAARRREAELRMQAQQTRVQQTADAARQKAEDEARREAATEAANAAARETAAQAARMAGNAGVNGGVPAGIVGAVENAAAKLSDGTTEQEIAGVMTRIVTALEGVPAAQQSAMQAALAPLMQRLANVEGQLRNTR